MGGFPIIEFTAIAAISMATGIIMVIGMITEIIIAAFIGMTEEVLIIVFGLTDTTIIPVMNFIMIATATASKEVFQLQRAGTSCI